MESELIHKIFSVSPGQFEDTALALFRFQYSNNPLYREFAQSLHINPTEVNSLTKIPFLPIQLFKSHEIKTTEFTPEIIFESSGTTGMATSKHYLKEPEVYRKSFLSGFKASYGNPSDWCIIGLLPSYLERNNSSLVVMVDELIQLSQHRYSDFYLNEHDKLISVLQELENKKQPTILIGVTHALLDIADKYSLDLQYTIIVETGGMKGRRAELTRPEVHHILKQKLGVSEVHSEYGMTELLSQAWSKGNGIFSCPGWMKILLRDEEDPLFVKDSNFAAHSLLNGVINVIDLANIYSCAFIATDDVGRLFEDGSFEVLGRMDNSDMRGCSLMAV